MRFKLLMFWNESNGVEQSSLPLLPKPHNNRPKSARIPARRFGERRKLKSREFGTAANLELVNLRIGVNSIFINFKKLYSYNHSL